MRRMLLAAVLVSMLLPAMAFAGGGAKATSKITVTNKQVPEQYQLCVIVDPSEAFYKDFSEGGAQATILRFYGGQIIEFAKSGSFSVKAGEHKIFAAFVNPESPWLGPAALATLTVKSSETFKFDVSISDIGTPVAVGGYPVFIPVD